MFADISNEIKDFLSKTIFKFQDFEFRYINIFNAILVIVIFRVLMLLIKKLILERYFKKNNIDPGSQYAITQVITYMVTIIAIMFVLQALGIKITILLAGSAALLVGIGLGFQQVFNDLISGVILLLEGSVRVNDVIETEGFIGKVEKIGIRTSIVITLENISIIVPNSKITSENVINWSHNEPIRRFSVDTRVAYGSDVEKVVEALKDATKNISSISKKYPVAVRFENFSESAIEFKVLFWTSDFMQIEAIKSDVRYNIDRIFRERNIKIPYPQRDIHMIKTD